MKYAFYPEADIPPHQKALIRNFFPFTHLMWYTNIGKVGYENMEIRTLDILLRAGEEPVLKGENNE